MRGSRVPACVRDASAPGRIDTPCVIAAVKALFRGHNDLIRGFAVFLPAGVGVDALGDVDGVDDGDVDVSVARKEGAGARFALLRRFNVLLVRSCGATTEPKHLHTRTCHAAGTRGPLHRCGRM